MNGVPTRRKELLVGCGVEVESEDQVKSMQPPLISISESLLCTLLPIFLVTTLDSCIILINGNK
jgi:hypothetical protein